MCFQFVSHSVSQSWEWLCSYVCLYPVNIAFYRKFCKIQNICLSNIIMFDVFSVCHSLGQSVISMTLFICWLISRNIAFHRKFYIIQNICLLNMILFDVFSACHSLGQSVIGMTFFICWFIPRDREYVFVKFVHVW